ncbi:MAG: outer membrane beta-barrel protein [bacterium]|nr:outer membrane beta-barrel protein [bacterium]
MRSLLFMGAIGILVLGLAVGASAEPYVAGYVGVALPFDQDIISENPTDVAITDFEPEDSVVFGARGGYWFDSFPYIGVEANVQAWFPDIDEQNVVVTRSNPPGVGNLAVATNRRFAAEVDAISMAVVLLGRYPFGDFVPYAGGGIGWTHVDFSRAQFDSLDVRADDDLFPHVQVQGGLKYFFTPNLGLFVEYMWQSKRFDTTIGMDGDDPEDIQTLEIDWDQQFIQGGLEWRFWDPFAQ